MKQEVEKLDLPYFSGNEKERCTFYALPKLLWSNETLNHLSNEAKLLYTFMTDRLSLSMEKNFRDNEGKLYIFFTVEEACYVLGKSTATVVRIFSELDSVKGLGLIERKKRGQGKADKIFLKNISGMEANHETYRETKAKKNEEVQIQHSPEIQAKSTVENSGLPTTYPSKVTPLPVSSDNSSIINLKSLECSKLKAIKTDKTNPDQKETDFLRPTLPQTPIVDFPQSSKMQVVWEGWEDGFEKNQWNSFSKEDKCSVIESNLERAYQQGQEVLTNYFYHLCGDEEKMELALYVLLGMDELDYVGQQSEDFSKENLEYKTTRLYSRAMLEMLTSKSLTKTKQGHISYAKVVEKFVPHIVFSKLSYRLELDSIHTCTVMAYLEANRESEIKFPLAYMKSCVWTTLLEGNIRDKAEFERLFG